MITCPKTSNFSLVSDKHKKREEKKKKLNWMLSLIVDSFFGQNSVYFYVADEHKQKKKETIFYFSLDESIPGKERGLRLLSLFFFIFSAFYVEEYLDKKAVERSISSGTKTFNEMQFSMKLR